jgi:hypothetical protein
MREGLYGRENFAQEVWPELVHDLNDDFHKSVATFIEKYF